MPRGSESPIGAERWSPNGYLYRKTKDGWRTVHTLLVEERLGRPITQDEYITFADGNKANFDLDNLIVRIRGRSSLRRRLAQVEARLAELTAVRDELLRKLQVRDKLGNELEETLNETS